MITTKVVIFNILLALFGITNAYITDYITSIQVDGKHYCGGTLIAPGWVLTSSLCLKDVDKSRITVRIGSVHANRGGKNRLANETHIYNDTTVGSYFDDVGLIKLDKKINARRSKLPEAGDYPNDVTSFNIYGYGYGEGDSSLNVVIVPTISIDKCRDVYGKEKITDSMFCTYEKEKDACQGDGGGPVMANDIQYGIISWGDGCGREGYPGVHTQIANPWIRNWIHRIAEV